MPNRVLRADTDESMWSALYSAEGGPLNMPDMGKTAINVLSHYGDEVLKVFPVEMAKKRK